MLSMLERYCIEHILEGCKEFWDLDLISIPLQVARREEGSKRTRPVSLVSK